MKIEKFPVYVNGEPYKVILKEKRKLCSGIDSFYLYHYFRVKFYLPDELLCKEGFCIDNSYAGYSDAKNYKAVIEEAVKRFEKKLHLEETQRKYIESVSEWDGK